MDPVELAVVIAGLLAIAAIAVFFFGPKGEATMATTTGGKQLVEVVVDGAYSPSEISLKANVPAQVVFDRRDRGDCTEWVIFDSLPTKDGGEIKTRLPEGKKTTVAFTPTKPGEYGFVCGMGMVHGKLIVT